MSNAWYYYLGPFSVATMFVIVGVVSLCLFRWGPREADGRRRYGLNAIVGGIFGLGVGGGIGVPFVLTSPTPWERARIYERVFHTPAESIERFIIKAGTPDQATPLTPTDVVIDDPARIRQMADILRTAPEVSANHPRTRWYAIVEMVTRDGTHYFSVGATEPGDRNGTLVSPWSTQEGGWNMGTVRADGVEEIIEGAVRRSK